MTKRSQEPLSFRQIDVLRAAPIGVDDASGGDPHKGGCYTYQGADGRIARSLWLRGLLEYVSVNPCGDDQGGLLKLTAHGLAMLDEARELLVRLRRAAENFGADQEPLRFQEPESRDVTVEQWGAEVEIWLAAQNRWQAWSPAGVAGVATPVSAPTPKLPSMTMTRGTIALLRKLSGGDALVATPDRGAGVTSRVYVLSSSGRVVPTRVARRAIEDRLVLPRGDGLFGPDTSQSWGFPTNLKPQES